MLCGIDRQNATDNGQGNPESDGRIVFAEMGIGCRFGCRSDRGFGTRDLGRSRVPGQSEVVTRHEMPSNGQLTIDNRQRRVPKRCRASMDNGKWTVDSKSLSLFAFIRVIRGQKLFARTLREPPRPPKNGCHPPL